jgi:hypothetical protein
LENPDEGEPTAAIGDFLVKAAARSFLERPIPNNPFAGW